MEGLNLLNKRDQRIKRLEKDVRIIKKTMKQVVELIEYYKEVGEEQTPEYFG
jgi:hypothetical protein